MRYLRLYGHFVRFSFMRALQFRLDFFFRVFMDALWYGVHLSFFWVLYRHTPLLGGWNFDQILVFTAGFFWVDATQMTLFSNNMWWLPILVNRGDLDYYLVRPVSSLFFVSLREFAPNSFLNWLMASGILAWTIARYPGELPAHRVAVYVALLGVGVLVFYVLAMLFLLPVFWMHNAAGMRDLFWQMDPYGHRPHRIYPRAVRILVVSLLPFAFFASFPAQALFEGLTPGLLLHTAGVAVIGFALLVRAWRAGLRAYSSASS